MGKNKSEGGPCDGCDAIRNCQIGQALEKLGNPTEKQKAVKAVLDTKKLFSTISTMRGESGCPLRKEAMDSTTQNHDSILEGLQNKFGIVLECPEKAKGKINLTKESSKKPESQKLPLTMEFDFTGADGPAIMQRLMDLSSKTTTYELAQKIGSNKFN